MIKTEAKTYLFVLHVLEFIVELLPGVNLFAKQPVIVFEFFRLNVQLEAQEGF